MPSHSFTVESPVTGQTWSFALDGEGDPTLEDIEEAAKHFDDQWFIQQGRDPSIAQQTPLETFGNRLANIGPDALTALDGVLQLNQALGKSPLAGISPLGAASQATKFLTGIDPLGFVSEQIQDIQAEGDRLRPTNPANATANTLGSAVNQVGAMLATGGTAALAGVPVKTAAAIVPQAIAFGAGADQGIETARQMGIEDPLAQAAMGAGFGGIEALTEKIGGIGGDLLKPAGTFLGRLAQNTATEVGEELLAGRLQDATTLAAGQFLEDPERPGFTQSGYELPSLNPLNPRTLEQMKQEAIGGAAGGVLFSGLQPLLTPSAPQSQMAADAAAVVARRSTQSGTQAMPQGSASGERIVAAAVIQPDGTVAVGRTHREADPSAPADRLARETADFGFVVAAPDGSQRFVSREEALQIATASGQLMPGAQVERGRLHSDQVQMQSSAAPGRQPPVSEFARDLDFSRMTSEEGQQAALFAEEIGADVPGAIAAYQQRFGNHISADNARSLYTPWDESRENRQRLSGALGVPGGKLAQLVFDDAVSRTRDDVVLFLAGGQGSGKTSAITPETTATAALVYDNTLSHPARAEANVRKALDNGNAVQVHFVYRPLPESVRGAIERGHGENGRIETPRQMAATHRASQQTFLKLMEVFADNPDVVFSLTDATGTTPQSPQGKAMTVAAFKQRVYQEPVAELQNMAENAAREYFDQHSDRFDSEFQARVLKSAGRPARPDADTRTGSRHAEASHASEGNGGPGASSLKEWDKTTFGQRLKADDRLRQAWRETIGGQYRVESEAEWQATANRFIEEEGPAGAFALMTDPDSGLADSDRVAIGLQLILSLDARIRELEAAGDAAGAADLDDLLHETAQWIELKGTKLGQAVRVFGMWTRMSAQGVLRSFERQVAEAREKQLTSHLGTDPAKLAADITAAAAEERAETAAEALGETAAEQLAELRQQIAELRQQLAQAQQEASAAQQEASQAPTPADAAQASQKVRKAEAKRKAAQRALTAAEDAQQRKASEAGKPRPARQRKPRVLSPDAIAWQWIDKLTFRHLIGGPPEPVRAAGALAQLIRAYIKAPDAASLPDFNTEARALGLPPAEAVELQRLLDMERASIAAIAQERAIARLVNQLAPKLPKTRERMPRFLKKLFEAHELGALDRPDFLKAYAEAFELPVMDDDMRKRIKTLIDAQRAAPEGYLKQQATTELMGELSKFKGIPALDVFTAFWYANVLSGLTTQGVNIFGNASHLLLKTLTVGATHNPRETWQFMRGLFEGARRGTAEAKAALKEGSVPFRTELNFSQGQVLELIHSNDPGAWAKFKNLAHLGKWVFRALQAGDAFFYHTAREGRAWLEASRYAATQQALNGGDFGQYMAEQLGNGPSRLAAAQAQAKAELAPSGRDTSFGHVDRRAWEIMESNRPADLNQKASRFGTLTTFTQEPEGLIGCFAAIINFAQRELKIDTRWGEVRFLTPFIPFVNIVANVTSTALDFTPVGIARGAMGRHIVRRKDDYKFDTWESRQRIASGLLGTLGTGMLLAFAMAFRERDDDEAPFMIYGMGPGTKARRDQMPQGWKPYTLKIGDGYFSYAETPLSLVLAIAGGAMDYLRYNPKGREDHALGAMAYAMSTAPEALLKTGVLSSLNDIFSLMEGERSWSQVGTRTASGFIPGQALLRDISELFEGDKIDDTTLAAGLFKDVPIVRGLIGKPALNVFGEPVQLDTLQRLPILKRLATRQAEDKDTLWLARNKLWMPGIDNHVELGTYLTEVDKQRTRGAGWREDRLRQLGRAAADVLTPEERYRLVQFSGPGLRQAIAESRQIQASYPKITRQQLQDQLNAKIVAQRRLAMKRVLGL